MRYWWVNQGQTYREEREGGYLWSPKRKRGRDGQATVRNPFNPKRHLVSRDMFKPSRSATLAEWRAVMA